MTISKDALIKEIEDLFEEEDLPPHKKVCLAILYRVVLDLRNPDYRKNAIRYLNCASSGFYKKENPYITIKDCHELLEIEFSLDEFRERIVEVSSFEVWSRRSLLKLKKE